MKVLPPLDIGDEGVQDVKVRMHEALSYLVVYVSDRAVIGIHANCRMTE